jgi:hypothetical protein
MLKSAILKPIERFTLTFFQGVLTAIHYGKKCTPFNRTCQSFLSGRKHWPQFLLSVTDPAPILIFPDKLPGQPAEPLQSFKISFFVGPGERILNLFLGKDRYWACHGARRKEPVSFFGDFE